MDEQLKIVIMHTPNQFLACPLVLHKKLMLITMSRMKIKYVKS